MVNQKENIQLNSISPDSINKIVRIISEKFSPYKIILFGSYSTGNQNPSSDLDIFMLMDTDLPSYKRATAIKLNIMPYSFPIDILVFTPAEVEYWNGAPNILLRK